MHLRLIPIYIFLLIPFLLLAQKIDREVLQDFRYKSEVHVIIEFHTYAQLRADITGMSKLEKGKYMYNFLTTAADKSQTRVKAYFHNIGEPFSSYYVVNAISAEITFAEAERIAQFREVKTIMPDPIIVNNLPDTLPINEEAQLRVEYTYGLDFLDVPEFWSITGARGEGVVVGGQDTGYQWDHPALIHAYRGYSQDTVNHNYSWHDAIHEAIDTSRANPCGYNLNHPCDDHGHGTHTMGTMIGADSGEVVFGIAPEAEWIGCRNMEGGVGRPSTYLECFEWFLAPTDLNGKNPRLALAPDVINNSWACPADEGCNTSNFHILEEAVNNLTLAGILVVVSAGNEGSSCGTVLHPPAIYQNSFSIGAINDRLDVAWFSSRGPVTIDSSYRIKPNVVAPGVAVYSAYPIDQYRKFSGTSMAGPHAAGMAALLMSAYPELKGKPYKIMAIMEQSAIPLSPDTSSCYKFGRPNNIWGYGMINLMRAKLFIDSMKTTSVSDVSQLVTQVSPTVTSSEINFTSNNSNGLITIRIWNAMGQLVYTQDMQRPSITIDVSSFPYGTYFYQISDSASISSGKFIVINP